MNSFNTHDDTKAILKKYDNTKIRIEHFNQSKFPRILRDTLTPLPKDANSSLSEW